MIVLRWEDPPSDSGRILDDVVDELRANPGFWALITESAGPDFGMSIRLGHLRLFGPPGSFEVRQQIVPDTDSYRVWVRYVGPEQVKAGAA